MTNSGAPIHIKPEQAISEAAALGEKIARGAELFSKLRDNEVTIATTPKARRQGLARAPRGESS